MKWNKNRERPQTLQTINAIPNKWHWKTCNSNFSFNCVYLEQKNNFNILISSNLIFDFWLILHLSKHNLKNFKLIRSFFSFISVFSCFFYRLNLFFLKQKWFSNVFFCCYWSLMAFLKVKYFVLKTHQNLNSVIQQVFNNLTQIAFYN